MEFWLSCGDGQFFELGQVVAAMFLGVVCGRSITMGWFYSQISSFVSWKRSASSRNVSFYSPWAAFSITLKFQFVDVSFRSLN